MAFELTTEEKVTKAKIFIQVNKPFFAYLLLNTELEANEKIKTMGVDFKGHIYYNPKFVEKLSQDELVGCLCHEIMHLALLHLIRLGNRKQRKWNISADLVINALIMKDREHTSPNGSIVKMSLPKCVLRPTGDGNYVLNGQRFTKLHEQSAEEVYDKIKDKKGKSGKGQEGDGEGQGEGQGDVPTDSDGDDNGDYGGFDEHIYGKKGEDGKEMSEKEKGEIERKWKKLFTEAAQYAKQRGTIPGGMERMLDKLLTPKVNWKNMILKSVSSCVPSDYTWRTPNRKSISVGMYIPNSIREQVEVTVAADLSGSTVGDYKRFMSECMGIVKQYPQVKMNVILWDTRVFKDVEVSNATAEGILKQKLNEGGGGTTFSCVAEHLEKAKKQPKMLIVFTDGCFEDDPKIPRCERLMWVLTHNGSDSVIKKCKGMLINLPQEECDDS
jgi:predicted metal-dependent peptidase